MTTMRANISPWKPTAWSCIGAQNWVLPGHEMQGFAAALMPSDGQPADRGTFVAIAADYAGPVTLPIFARARP